MRTPRRPTPPAWLEPIGVGNLLATAVLVAAAFPLVAGQPTVGPIAYLLVPATVLPLLAMRRHPSAAPVAVAIGTLLTQLVAGPIVTCGVVVPATLIMSFQLGSRTVSTRQLGIGGLGLIAVGLVEVLLDPVLRTLDAAVFVFGLGSTLFMAGLVVRSRVRMAQALRRRTSELAEQRDRTADLAVATDRERIGADLDVTVRARVAEIARIAAAGRSAAAAPSPASRDSAREILGEIERRGRDLLVEMRAVVGTMRDAPTVPPPDLGDLADLLGQDARLRFLGEPRSLPPNVELCAYRIVERLLTVIGSRDRVPVVVTVRFEPDALCLDVVGATPLDRAAPDEAAATAALSAARTRAQVLGGRLAATAQAHHRPRVEVVLPVPALTGEHLHG